MDSAHEAKFGVALVCSDCGEEMSPRRFKSMLCKKCYRAPRFHGTYCEWCEGKIVTAANNRSTARFCSRRCKERSQYSKRNPDFKENYFSTPNLENSYWAGFIAGDGCINDKDEWQSQIRFSLSIVDKAHLEKLHSVIGAGSLRESVTYLKSTGRSYPKFEYTLYSDKICNDLAENFNIHPNKSLTHEPPNLEGDLALAFIAGYIDADGSYTHARYRRPVLTTVGTNHFLSWMNHILKVDSKVICCGNFYSTTVGGDKAIKIRDSIHNLNLPLLDRKINRWEELNLNLEILNKGE